MPLVADLSVSGLSAFAGGEWFGQVSFTLLLLIVSLDRSDT